MDVTILHVCSDLHHNAIIHAVRLILAGSAWILERKPLWYNTKSMRMVTPRCHRASSPSLSHERHYNSKKHGLHFTNDNILPLLIASFDSITSCIMTTIVPRMIRWPRFRVPMIWLRPRIGNGKRSRALPVTRDTHVTREWHLWNAHMTHSCRTVT